MLKKYKANGIKLSFPKKWIKLMLGISILLITACNLDREKKITDSDLLHVLAITNCDLLMTDEIFQKHNQINWTKSKPKNLVEAVIHLDSMTNDYTKHLFSICDAGNFHFGFGMEIRNEWVHTGEDDFKDQLFEKLKLSHFDYSSGMILWLYNQYLTESPIKIMEELEEGIDLKSDSMQIAKSEYQLIEKELNKLKNENGD